MKRNDTLTNFFSPQLLLGLLLFFCLLIAAALTASAETVSRTLSVQQSVARGQNKTVIIEMEGVGNENAVGFSLNFDSTKLRYIMSATGNGTLNAALNINTNALSSGRLGLAMALPRGQIIPTGKQQVAVITFNVLASDNVAGTTLSFGDQPIPREVVDVAANEVAANFSSGTLTFAQSMAIGPAIITALYSDGTLSVANVDITTVAAALFTAAHRRLTGQPTHGHLWRERPLRTGRGPLPLRATGSLTPCFLL